MKNSDENFSERVGVGILPTVPYSGKILCREKINYKNIFFAIFKRPLFKNKIYRNGLFSNCASHLYIGIVKNLRAL